MNLATQTAASTVIVLAATVALAFYSDGLLACSMNVGGAVSGGQCTITYGTYGTHTINAVEAPTRSTRSSHLPSQ